MAEPPCPPLPSPGGRLLTHVFGSPRVTHVERVPPRAGRVSAWPSWVPPLLQARCELTGIRAPWEHQVRAAELAHAGRSVVLATGAASGKSLGYLLPVLERLLGSTATALYLAPTKALAADQLRAIRALRLTQARAATYDGDTPMAERDWVRAHANLVLTNPDMLHRGMLPQHSRWASFWRRLEYVVVDECHGYRGVFGSHVAHVLRRLRRVCLATASRPPSCWPPRRWPTRPGRPAGSPACR